MNLVPSGVENKQGCSLVSVGCHHKPGKPAHEKVVKGAKKSAKKCKNNKENTLVQGSQPLLCVRTKLDGLDLEGLRGQLGWVNLFMGQVQIDRHGSPRAP